MHSLLLFLYLDYSKEFGFEHAESPPISYIHSWHLNRFWLFLSDNK